METSSEKELLKDYLNQYYRAKIRREQLEKRLINVRVEMAHPIQGVNYAPTPHSNTNNTNYGPAEALVMLGTEIEELICQQQKVITRMMMNVMHVMNYLDVDSTERAIMEYRHIDCLSWKTIYRKMNLTRTPCFSYYNNGLHLLLAVEDVRNILEEYSRRHDILKERN